MNIVLTHFIYIRMNANRSILLLYLCAFHLVLLVLLSMYDVHIFKLLRWTCTHRCLLFQDSYVCFICHAFMYFFVYKYKPHYIFIELCSIWTFQHAKLFLLPFSFPFNEWSVFIHGFVVYILAIFGSCVCVYVWIRCKREWSTNLILFSPLNRFKWKWMCGYTAAKITKHLIGWKKSMEGSKFS